MNRLLGRVTNIKSSGEISLVEVTINEDIFSAIVIESIDSFFKIGNEILLLFKETEVALARNLSGKISLRNRFETRVIEIERGELLSVIKLDYKGKEITSVITTASAESLELSIGADVTAFVKTNELMLMEANNNE